jgi:hypothetical protein
MKELKAGDLQDKLENKRLSEKEPPGCRARIITAVTVALLPIIFFYPAVIDNAILASGDAWSSIDSVKKYAAKSG